MPSNNTGITYRGRLFDVDILKGFGRGAVELAKLLLDVYAAYISDGTEEADRILKKYLGRYK